MSMISNIGVRALLANQSALQTVSNNIANVNSPGYSRQSVIQTNVAGEFSGSGYFGKGVDIITVQRSYDNFLIRQSALSASIAASDSVRSGKLSELENVFQGGPSGLGAAVSSFFNSFSDITNAPTDLTARSVTLTRADELAARFRDAARQLNDLQLGTAEQIKSDVTTINSLAQRIASINEQVARTLGAGHSPNDLLDQRDQLIRDLNKYVQTTQIPADDGSVGIFLASSQPLVLGTTVSPVSLKSDEFGLSNRQLTITVGGVEHSLDESTLGGGEIAGLLRFQNTDLVDATNLLGRMALAIGTKVNEQQALGVDLKGQRGNALFSLRTIPNAMPLVPPAPGVPSTAAITISVQPPPNSGTTAFVPSDYEIQFTTGTTGTIKRLSDGTVTNFNTGATNPIALDGLNIQIPVAPATVPVAGDKFLIRPFVAAADSMTTAFSTPSGLAMANPLAGQAGLNNQGSLTLNNLAVTVVPAGSPPPTMPPVNFSFAAPPANTYTYTYTSNIAPFPVVNGSGTYTPGTPMTVSADGWTFNLSLKGIPGTATPQDSFTVLPNSYPQQNAGNADAMLNLRDLAMFDGGPLTDGYAGLMAQVGTRVQSAKSAATVSQNIAIELEKERSNVAGVNLDEEAAKMLQYQQAYQAAGKMLQVSQNIFDTLLQSLSR